MSNYFMETQHHEWLLTNELGGYALGTGNLVHQRKYHGLLIAGHGELDRRHLVSSLEEKVEWRGMEFHLDSNNYSHLIHPEGFQHLVKSWLRPYPVFLYSACPPNDSILILREIMFDRHSNTVLVRYTNSGNHLLHFVVRPKLTLRNHHQINLPGAWDEEKLHTLINFVGEGSFHALRASNHMEVYGFTQSGEWSYDTVIYRRVFYPWEVMRGYDGSGDKIAPVRLNFDLAPGETSWLLFSDAALENPEKAAGIIIDQYAKLPKPADFPVPVEGESILAKLDFDGSDLFSQKQYRELLDESMRDFIASQSIIAGFPWFGSRGRDTFLFLEAAFELPEGVDLAWSVLHRWAERMQDGLIPNFLRESSVEDNFDAVDPSLWFMLLLHKTAQLKAQRTYTPDERAAVWQDAWLLAKRTIEGILGHQRIFTFRENGLIEIREDWDHSTWMNARVRNESVTPRSGAPIEINALWYNALRAYDEIRKATGQSGDDPRIERYLTSLPEALELFWNGDTLADRLDGDERVDEIRPNALIACALPWDIIDRDRMKSVLKRIETDLLTPYGIRTLSPDDYRFRKKYLGSQFERDTAYHQGTVWAWLFMPWAAVRVKCHDPEDTPESLAQVLSNTIFKFRNGYRKGHIASIAEVWDGDHPHFPKGSPAYALSVAAQLYTEFLAQRIASGEVDPDTFAGLFTTGMTGGDA